MTQKWTLIFDHFLKQEKIVLNYLKCGGKTRRCVTKSQTVKVRAKRSNSLYFVTLVSCDEKRKMSQICTLEKLEVEEEKYECLFIDDILVLLRIINQNSEYFDIIINNR